MTKEKTQADRFKVVLKPGTELMATAYLLTYGKAFTSNRFLWSTGIQVNREKFDPAKLSSSIKEKRQAAETAYTSLQNEGTPINNNTLKNRIELIRDKFVFIGNELQLWAGVKVEVFTVPDRVNTKKLEAELKQELTKHEPNLKKIINTHLSEGANELFGFWQSIIDGETKPRKGKRLKASSIGGKRNAMLLVKEFDPEATFAKMDMAFYNRFVSWMEKKVIVEKKGKEKKGYEANTIGKIIRQTKSVLHLAYSNELMDHDRFKYWPVTQESNEVVTLSKDELLRISNLKLKGTQKDVRDIFVLASFLGPRISDFKAFKRENLSVEAGITFFSYTQEKTGAICKIPLTDIPLQIIEDREGEFPKMISEQNFRYILKDICKKKEAELTDKVIVKIRNNKNVYKTKWEAISPHSARRTFASNLFYGWFSRAMPAALCMRYTGHKTEKSFMLYIGASDKELNDKALQYFDITPQMKVS